MLLSYFVLFQFCSEYTVPRDKIEHFKNITAQDIVCSQVFKSSCSYCTVPDLLMVFICISYHLFILSFMSWQNSSGVTLKEEDVAVSNVKIDLTRGKDNPLDRYYCTDAQSLLTVLCVCYNYWWFCFPVCVSRICFFQVNVLPLQNIKLNIVFLWTVKT